MTAYAGSNPRRPDRESPPSNTAYWSSQPCPRIVRVTFDSFSTFHLGDDEWWAEGSVGPIYGNFWACGSTEGSLSFSAVDYGDWWGERDRGYRLRSTRYYRIQEIFLGSPRDGLVFGQRLPGVLRSAYQLCHR